MGDASCSDMIADSSLISVEVDFNGEAGVEWTWGQLSFNLNGQPYSVEETSGTLFSNDSQSKIYTL